MLVIKQIISIAVSTFVCAGMALGSASGSRVAVEPPVAHPAFTRAEVERMTADQFIAAYNKRGTHVFESGYDIATRYYADVKADLHDRQAAKVSATLRNMVREIRRNLENSEWMAFDDTWTMDMGTVYLHMFRWSSTSREDAIGNVLRSLRTGVRSKRSTNKLLRRLAALDSRIPGTRQSYHKLSKALSGLPFETINIILKQEQNTVDLLVSFKQ